MPDMQQRLTSCFQAVFPELSDNDLKRATVDRVSAWDSIATVTLAATVEEEFGFQFVPGEIEKLTSYDKFLQYLEKRKPS